MALNMMREEKTKISIPMNQKCCMMNPAFLEQVLMAGLHQWQINAAHADALRRRRSAVQFQNILMNFTKKSILYEWIREYSLSTEKDWYTGITASKQKINLQFSLRSWFGLSKGLTV